MQPTFSFETQLKLGNEGEQIFFDKYKDYFEKNNSQNVMAPDFINKKTGALAEIKFDNSTRAARDSNKLQKNFFVEMFSNSREMTLGGPFRAVEEGVDYYVYMFKEPFRIFIFDAVKFKNKAARIINEENYKPKPVKNKTWYTSGYALPINLFEECRITEEIMCSGKKLNNITV